MEEKTKEVDKILSRSIVQRSVYATEDVASIAQIVRFITGSIEIITVS